MRNWETNIFAMQNHKQVQKVKVPDSFGIASEKLFIRRTK